jgi:hypothetical protein
MRTWLGLLAAPVLVLGVQSADYALIQPSCATGTFALNVGEWVRRFRFVIFWFLVAGHYGRLTPQLFHSTYCPNSRSHLWDALLDALTRSLQSRIPFPGCWQRSGTFSLKRRRPGIAGPAALQRFSGYGEKPSRWAKTGISLLPSDPPVADGQCACMFRLPGQ